jgi:hypothetical protein
MTNDERQNEKPEDAKLIASIAGAYAPPELSRSRRAAIDQAARARIEQRPLAWMWPAAMAGTAAAAGLAVVLLRSTGPGDDAQPAAATSVASVDPGAASAPARANGAGGDTTEWTYSMLFESVEGAARDRAAELPDDYQAITDVWLEG